MTDAHRLLLVDDEADFLEIMAKYFTRRQMSYETAGNCNEAMIRLANQYFNVIIMDVGMPGLDGLACMAEIKKNWPDIEIIILTGHASMNMGVEGMKNGAFDYCLKPVDFDDLLEKILLAGKAGENKKR